MRRVKIYEFGGAMQQPSNDFVDSKSSPENPLPDAQPKEHVLKTEEHPVHEAY